MSPPSNLKVVCVSGSLRLRDALVLAAQVETFAGNVVLPIVPLPASVEEALTPEVKARLDAAHLRKIELADEVLFVAYGEGAANLGPSCKRELEHAAALGKIVRWFDAHESARMYNTREMRAILPDPEWSVPQ